MYVILCWRHVLVFRQRVNLAVLSIIGFPETFRKMSYEIKLSLACNMLLKYWLFIFLCLFTGDLNLEFSYSMAFTTLLTITHDKLNPMRNPIANYSWKKNVLPQIFWYSYSNINTAYFVLRRFCEKSLKDAIQIIWFPRLYLKCTNRYRKRTYLDSLTHR